MLGTNQDVLVQLSDFVSSVIAKSVGGSLAGLPGYAAGMLVDTATTSGSLYYDHQRNFGSWESHISIGIASNGLVYILIYP